MIKIEIISSCVCAGRNVSAGQLLDPDTIPAEDLRIIIGSGLAREVERFEAKAPVSIPVQKVAKKAKK